MRMLGLGLLAFLLAGAAIALSYLRTDNTAPLAAATSTVSASAARSQQVATDPTLIFDQVTPVDSDRADQKQLTLRAEPEEPMILSGVPSYQSATFVLPFDAKPVGGTLVIDTTAQTLLNIEVSMRVTINGTRRGEMLLTEGMKKRQIEIPLTSEELAGGLLNVNFSLQGHGTNAPCSEDGIGAVVEIDPSSALHLQLAQPISSVRDRVIAWGDTVRMGWAPSLAENIRQERLTLAAELIRDKYQIAFRQKENADALDSAQATTLLTMAPIPQAMRTKSQQESMVYNWPVDLSELNGNAGARYFYRDTSWRARFDPSQFPDGEVPSMLNLSMALGPLPKDTDWNVSVTLNGNLISAERVAGDVLRYDRQIQLPALSTNQAVVFQITVSSDYDVVGICNNGPQLVAELRPGTTVTGGPSSRPDGVAYLRRQIANDGVLRVSLGTDINAQEAAATAGLISAIAPANAVLQAGNDATHPRAVAISGSQVQNTGSYGPSGWDQWVVWYDPDSQIPQAMQLSQMQQTYGGVIWPAALIVSLPRPTQPYQTSQSGG